MFRFQCACCGKWHEGVPGFAAAAPLFFYYIPEAERPTRCKLTSDTCIIDDEHFFIRGCIEIPVEGTDEPFIWGAWVSLSRENFAEYTSRGDDADREQLGPYFGWLSASFIGYPDAENLKTRVRPREAGVRPLIELEPTDHPLAIEQRKGITAERVGEIFAAYEH